MCDCHDYKLCFATLITQSQGSQNIVDLPYQANERNGKKEEPILVKSLS